LHKNIPIGSSGNIPLALLGQCDYGGYKKRRRYIRAQEIEQLAVKKYKGNGKGMTFNDLLTSGLAMHKEQAQITLKHCLEKQVLFTISNHKPQRYYPTSLRGEILKNKLSKNLPIGVTEVPYSKAPLLHGNKTNNNNSCTESIAIQSLEGYVLPLLPSAPLRIHKIQLKLKITPDCYSELGSLSIDSSNKGKEHVEVIGKFRVSSFLCKWYGHGFY
jgi:hypothetical protein